MELKKYQEETLRDLAQYIDVLNESNSLSVAYSRYWEQRGVSVSGMDHTSIVSIRCPVSH